MLLISSSSIFCEQKFVKHGPITIAIDCNGLSLLIFKEKWPNYASGSKSASNSDLFWLCRLFNVCVRVFCVPNATILLVYISVKIKISFVCKEYFVLPKSASSVSRSQAHLAKRKRIGWSIGFNSWINWTLYVVIPRSLCKIRLNDVSEMFNCWERRWIDVDDASHTLSAIAAIFLSTPLRFWLFTLWFIDEDASFFYFFHKIRYLVLELTVLLFFQNPYAIFAYILQHYYDFQSNVAIFNRVVQAYTQAYSFGGRIKLIICQIRHQLIVTYVVEELLELTVRSDAVIIANSHWTEDLT